MSFINTIGKRIGLGYAAIGLIMIVTLLMMHIMTSDLMTTARRASDVRAPTTVAATKVLLGLADTQPALRRWISDSDEASLQIVRENWQTEAEPAIASLKELSRFWLREENKQAFQDFLSRIDEWRTLIKQLSGTADHATALREFNQKVPELSGFLRNRLQILLANQTKDLVSDLEYQESKLVQVEWTRISLIGLVILVSLIAATVVSRSVGRPLGRAVELADLVAGGNFSTKVSVAGTDELNRLGASLERMRLSLEKQNWLQQSQIRLHEAIRGAGDTKELAESLIGTVVNSSQAHVGAFYSAENKSLKVLGGFALPPESSTKNEIQFGRGISGQAASSKKLLSVTAQESETLELSTMVGQVKPKEVLAAPLMLHDEVIGVIELATVGHFGSKEREFVGLAAQAAAVALNATQKAEQVRNLLEETQTMAEELQSQQEELRNSNEELQTRQEELEATNEELEEQKSILEAQKHELDSKNDELHQISKYKSEFLANMSHELRTPLNSQLILSGLLSENKDGNLTAKQVEYARTIRESGLNLLQLINDILDLSKVEAGKLSLEVQSVSIREVVDALSHDFAPSVEQKGLKLFTKIHPEVPDVMQTDSLRLAQILRNLLSNAVKFTESGEIRLTVEPEDNMISFKVTDTGVGIPEDKVDSIFEAFEQVDSSTSRKYGGTGLGLAISKGLSELLGGEIRLTSKLGEGSTFTLTLPHAIEVSESSGLKFRQPSSSQKKGNSILIIEDDPSFAESLATVAREKGFNATIIPDGAKGLEYARQNLPACIVLDDSLPGTDGLQILRALKKDARTRDIPVHMISNDDHSREASELGAIGHLLKPASSAKLSQVMGQLQSFTQNSIRRVLVVEDEAIQREQIKTLVESDTVVLTTASNAEEALLVLKREKPFDCMVLDLGLPDHSGLELLKKIREEKSIVLPPVIIHTAKDLTLIEEEALRHYSESIIIKGAGSDERLLDEVSLFIHKVVRKLPQVEQKRIESANQKEPSFVGKKILLVDDDMRNIFALSETMTEKNLEVVVARNGQEAIDKLNSESGIHLVLMDIMMPVMDGHEAMRQIRKSPRHANIPIIALTAKAMKGDKQACLEAGANDYLAKPIDTKQLFSLLRVWLNR